MSESVDMQAVDEILARQGRAPEKLIAILQQIQQTYHYLPEAALRRVCDQTEITPADIVAVATFYSQFRMEPAGRHTVRVCIGTACHVKGAQTVFDAFKRELKIPAALDTDAERLFTVEKVACLGCCMLAPAVQIDDITYGFVEPGKVGGVLSDFLAAQKARGTDEEGSTAGTAAVLGTVRMCLCSSCVAGGSARVYDAIREQVRALRLSAVVKTVGCTGESWHVPLVELAMADGTQFRYGMVRPEDVRSLLLRHFRPMSAGVRVRTAISSLLERLLTDEAHDIPTRFRVETRLEEDLHREDGQHRIATECAGQLTPEDLDEYIASGGFVALARVLEDQDAEHVLEELRLSGLRGRGGAGFPSVRKWQTVRGQDATQRYIICNGDEGDPGAFMDRMILESFPYRVVEGMAIAGYTVGAGRGYIFVRSEYPLAVTRVRAVIETCRRKGLLGTTVMGKPFAFDIEVVSGAGAFVCGEETALVAAIEGRRGMPRYRPPYPAEHGLWGKPTLVNNVETFSLVSWIIRHGGKAFASVGTAGGRGTKTFALAGRVVRGGLIEVPMGMTLREVVERIGGGVPDGGTLKAVQVGGPSGGCVPASLADTPVDYEALTAAGAIMGSGGLVVLDNTDCMVEIARYFMDFTQHESCGKCTFCRVGTKRMLEILERLCAGRGRAGDIEELERLGEWIQRGSLCGLGKTAPNPVLSTLRHFRDEYEAHVNGSCPAKRCKALIRYTITDACIGCTRCAQRCPADAIAMVPYQRHTIDDETCVRCDTCRQECPADAIEIQTGPPEEADT